MWFGLAPRTDTKKHVFKRDRTVARNIIIILGSIVNTIVGGTIWPFNENENLHFLNKEDIHMSSWVYEESGYSLNFDLLAILY